MVPSLKCHNIAKNTSTVFHTTSQGIHRFSVRPSLRPSIFNRLSRVWLWRKQFQQRVPFPGHINQLWLGDSKALLGQRGDIVPPPGPRSTPRSPPSWTCSKRRPGGILTRLYSVFLPDDFNSHLSLREMSATPGGNRFRLLVSAISFFNHRWE